MKKQLSLFLSALLAVSLVGCSSKSTATSTSNALQDTTQNVDSSRKSTADGTGQYDKITVALPADPIDLMPHSPNSDYKGYAVGLIYEDLFFYQDGNYVPNLAKDYQQVDDTHWIVNIRDNIYDTDGNHITADDVVFDFTWLVGTGYVHRFDTYGGVVKTGDYQVEFTWTSAIDSVAELETIFADSYIFSEKAFNSHNFATDPVGTGPYKLESFTAGSEIVLTENDNYWAKDLTDKNFHQQQKVKTIDYKIVTQGSQNAIGLSTGDLDVSMNVPSDSLVDFQDGGQYADKYNVVEQNSTELNWLTWNQNTGLIGADVNFRLACSWAISNAALAKVAGLYTAADTFASPASPEYNSDWVVSDGYVVNTDLDKAKEYLKKTSYNGEKLKIVCLNSEAYKNIATTIVNSLAQIGINVEVNAVDNLTFDSLLKNGDYDLTCSFMGGSYLPGALNHLINYGDFAADAGCGNIRDQKLLDLWKAYYLQATYDDEHATALEDYIYENDFFYPTVVPYSVVVANSNLAKVFYQPGSTTIWFNACDYYLD